MSSSSDNDLDLGLSSWFSGTIETAIGIVVDETFPGGGGDTPGDVSTDLTAAIHRAFSNSIGILERPDWDEIRSEISHGLDILKSVTVTFGCHFASTTDERVMQPSLVQSAIARFSQREYKEFFKALSTNAAFVIVWGAANDIIKRSTQDGIADEKLLSLIHI